VNYTNITAIEWNFRALVCVKVSLGLVRETGLMALTIHVVVTM